MRTPLLPRAAVCLAATCLLAACGAPSAADLDSAVLAVPGAGVSLEPMPMPMTPETDADADARYTPRKGGSRPISDRHKRVIRSNCTQGRTQRLQHKPAQHLLLLRRELRLRRERLHVRGLLHVEVEVYNIRASCRATLTSAGSERPTRATARTLGHLDRRTDEEREEREGASEETHGGRGPGRCGADTS